MNDPATPPSLASRLSERKLVQWGVAYAAVGWGLLQLLDFLRENFGWSVGIVRALTVAVGVGLAATLVVGWFHGQRGRQRIGSAEVLTLGLVVVLGGITTLWAYRSAPADSDIPPQARVAILPLANGTGDESQDFYAEGITRELIGLLADAGIRVLGYRAVEPYADRRADAFLAEQLNVDAIAVGSVQRNGDVIRIGVELVDPTNGETLWADVMSRAGADVLTLEREIATEIAQGLQAELSPTSLQSLQAEVVVNPEAYAQYLLGRQQMLRWTEDGFHRSVQHFEGALEIDASFAPAWASLAVTYCYALFYAWVEPASARATIETAASQAVALDASSGEGHAARGWASLLLDWDLEAANEQLNRAGALSQSVSTLYPLFLTHWYSGRFEEAGEIALELAAVEPTTAVFQSDYGWTRWAAGDMTGARAAASRAIEEDPTFWEAHHLLAYADLAVGRYQEARTNLERAQAVAGGDYHWRWALDGDIRAAMGDTTGVHDLLAQMEADRTTPRYGQRADLLFHIGMPDSAFVLLRRGVDTKGADALLYLRGHWELDPWRGEPAFASLLREVGLDRE